MGVASLTLGYGRSRAGAIGNGVGANAYALRTLGEPLDGSAGRRSSQDGAPRAEILTTQNVVRHAGDVRELYPLSQLGQPRRRARRPRDPPSLMPPAVKPGDGHAWAMVIDTSVCIGCNACVVACQAENNVPVVGPEEVAHGPRHALAARRRLRPRHARDSPQPGFQPVPCMHCEHAPCEPVCPVAASVHDSEGLNVQVYNRCIGTRFCEANCPYKVRRFNFFGYADGQEYANLGAESARGAEQPGGHGARPRRDGEVHLLRPAHQRAHGARPSARIARSAADEVTTACQNACPTRAIIFGDLQPGDAASARCKADPRHYALARASRTRGRAPPTLPTFAIPHPELEEDGT